jgi:hypothetical protein
MVTDDPTTYDYTDSSIYDNSELSGCEYTDQSGPGISSHLPPSSGVASEVSSAVTSDSDLPPVPPFKSSKPTQKSSLLNYFAPTSAAEAHAVWGKRKRENQDRDEEKHAEVRRKEEKWKQKKASDMRERNRLSQQKCREKILGQEINVGIRDKDGKKIQVS